MSNIDFDNILTSELGWAVDQKRSLTPQDSQEAFQMRVRAVGPNGEIATIPGAIWSDRQQQRRVMQAVSEACKEIGAAAIVVTSDARFLLPKNFSEHFNIPMVTLDTMESWEKERQRIMKGYGNLMGNLPRHTWDEALICSIYGPRVKKFGMLAYRAKGPEFVFDPPIITNEESKFQQYMIPAWWQ